MQRYPDDEPLDAAKILKVRARRVATVRGHDPRSAYVERFWLPVLGPSTVFLLRHLAAALDGREVAVLDADSTARSLGLGGRRGRHGPFVRCLRRARDFDMLEFDAVRDDALELVVRRELPPLSPRLVERLPEELALEHRRVAKGAGVPSGAQATRLARSLAALGESQDSIAGQLERWRFPAPLARRVAEAVSERGF